DCDDGGPSADYNFCDFGTDCSDCGARNDADGDGFYDDEGTIPLDTTLVLDCDDTESTTYPGAPEITNDGIDQDCDGVDATVVCLDTCQYANDGDCDDGGTNSDYSYCDLGTDCGDCGPRLDVDEDGIDSVSDCDDSDPNIGFISSVDTQEPTDFSSPVDIGSLVNSSDTVSGTGYFYDPLDEDAFTFYFEDVSDFLPPDDDEFYCTITAPPGVDILVDVYNPSGNYEGSMDQQSFGGDESFVWDNATYGINDDGIYKVVVTSLAGENCSTPYTISCSRN
ncbi:MAG: MopE-related protein, partial [Myxococcota bacterium]|nr:MopE-related protein [Myxococcota bacterium]